jgi:hypothetical protein
MEFHEEFSHVAVFSYVLKTDPFQRKRMMVQYFNATSDEDARREAGVGMDFLRASCNSAKLEQLVHYRHLPLL